MRKLTTTSYALLGLLALREWTAYELVEQMRRSLGYIWPRAQSGVYAELHALVERELTTSRVEQVGGRIRTCYQITPTGRAALAGWVVAPPTASRFESEAALQLIFSDQAGTDQALAAVDALDRDARARQEELLEVFAEYADGGGRFRDRAHVSALAARLYHEHYAAVGRWADWARAEIASWPTTDSRTAHRGAGVARANRADFGDRSGNEPG